MNLKTKPNQYIALLIQFLILFVYVEIHIVFDDDSLLFSIFGTVILFVLQAILILNNTIKIQHQLAIGIIKFISIIVIIVGYYMNSSDPYRTSSPIWLIQFFLIGRRENLETIIDLGEGVNEQPNQLLKGFEYFSSKLIQQNKQYKQYRKEILSQIQMDTSITPLIEINLEKAKAYYIDTELASKEFSQLSQLKVQLSQNQYSIDDILIGKQLFSLNKLKILQEQIFNPTIESSNQFQTLLIQIKQFKYEQRGNIMKIQTLNSQLISQISDNINTIKQEIRENTENINKSEEIKHLKLNLNALKHRKLNIELLNKQIKSQTKQIQKIECKIEDKFMKIQLYQQELRKITLNFQLDTQQNDIDYYIQHKLEEIIANPSRTEKINFLRFIGELFKERITSQIQLKEKLRLESDYQKAAKQ